MEGEDLVSPFEEGVDEWLEFGKSPGVVTVDELSEGLVGFLVVFGLVDAVQRLVELPGVSQFGVAGQDLFEAGPGLVVEAVGSS